MSSRGAYAVPVAFAFSAIWSGRNSNFSSGGLIRSRPDALRAFAASRVGAIGWVVSAESWSSLGPATRCGAKSTWTTLPATESMTTLKSSGWAYKF